MSGTAHRVLLVDLDDTIYDRTPHRLEFALERLGRHPLLDYLPPSRLAKHIGMVRALAPMFTALGFPSTQHRQDRRLFLAGMMLVFARTRDVARVWRIPEANLHVCRHMVGQFLDCLKLGPPATWQAYLAEQLTFARALNGIGAIEFRESLSRLIDDDQIAALADQAADTVRWQPRRGFRRWWSALSQAGVHCYIASEGEEDLQIEKLESLGLGAEFHRVLITSERAARPLDTVDFECHSSGEFARAGVAITDRAWERIRSVLPDEAACSDCFVAELGAEIPQLAAARWVLGTFLRKASGYYARAIHAVVVSPTHPGRALDSFDIVDPSTWPETDVRVAMLGNYHAKDVVPIQQLLGPHGSWTGLLDLGAHRGSKPSDASFVASQTFPSWVAAMRYVESEIPWNRIQPARNVRPRFDSGTVDLVRQASQDSRFRVLGQLSKFLWS